MSNKLKSRKLKLLKLKATSVSHIINPIAKKWIVTESKINPIITNYKIIGYSKDIDCKHISHGSLVIHTNNGMMYIFEYGNLTGVNDDTRITHHKHPKESWFVCKLRDKDIRKKKIKLKQILLHAEFWKQEIKYIWNKTSYPNNCYGYVDSAIVSVFGDHPLSKDAIRW